MRKFAIVLALLATGCGRKTYLSVKDVQRSDSLLLRVDKIVAPVLTDVIVLEELCRDSVATVFKKVYVRERDTIRIEVKDNALLVDIRQKERTIKELNQTIKNTKQAEKAKEVITKERILWKPIWVLSGVILLFIFLPVIPKTINKLIKGL